MLHFEANEEKEKYELSRHHSLFDGLVKQVAAAM